MLRLRLPALDWLSPNLLTQKQWLSGSRDGKSLHFQVIPSLSVWIFSIFSVFLPLQSWRNVRLLMIHSWFEVLKLSKIRSLIHALAGNARSTCFSSKTIPSLWACRWLHPLNARWGTRDVGMFTRSASGAETHDHIGPKKQSFLKQEYQQEIKN